MPFTLNSVFSPFPTVITLYAQSLVPPLANSDINSEGAIRRSFLQFVARYNQRGLIPRLNIYHQVCIAIDGILSQPVQIAIQMNHRPCSDLSAYDLGTSSSAPSLHGS